MRFLLTFFLLLAGVVGCMADETMQEYGARVQRHVDNIRYNPAVSAAADRRDARRIEISFLVAADGDIRDVKVRRSAFSPETSKLIARCFADLPNVPMVPRNIGAVRFGVTLSLGGIVEKK